MRRWHTICPAVNGMQLSAFDSEQCRQIRPAQRRSEELVILAGQSLEDVLKSMAARVSLVEDWLPSIRLIP